MTHNFLEELEIPQPPYRMARPMATLTASDEPQKPLTEAPPPHRADMMSDEALRKEFEAALPDIEEKRDTLEAVDASVTEAKDGAEKRIDAVPTPDVAAKDTAKAEVEEAASWYKGKVNGGGRTAEEASQEFKGEGKPPTSLQEEYESTEAALKRAEMAGNPKEVERLAKQVQEYSTVIVNRPSVVGTPPPSERTEKMPSPDETLPPTPISEIAPAVPEVGSDTINVEPGEPMRPVRETLRPESTPEPAKPEAPSEPATAETAPVAPEAAPAPAAERPRVGSENPLEFAVQQQETRRAEAAERATRPFESGYLRSAVEWASKKTGAGAWLDTLLPRLKSVYHRQFAERRAWMQEKARGSLDRAISKQEDFAAKSADASWPLKKYYAWRERVWAKSVAKREAIVNKHDLYRTRRIERHNELQRQVSGRYERELAPYRGIKESLEREQKTVKQVIATLEERYQTALKALEVAEGKRSGLFGRRGKAAADRIRRSVNEIRQRVNEQRKNLDRVNKPLANAGMKIDKYEAKQRSVSAVMKFPEMEGLKIARRAKPGPHPGRRAFNTYTTETVSGTATEAGDRSAEEWTPGDFVREWNGNGLVRIGDAAAFEKYVTDQRTAAGESGPVKLDRMLELTEGYLTSTGSARGFARDRRFFLSTVRKSSTP